MKTGSVAPVSEVSGHDEIMLYNESCLFCVHDETLDDLELEN